MSYGLDMVDEVRDWLHSLRRFDRQTAVLVGQAVTALLDEGPGLGRPLVDRVKGSSLHNLKELRPGSSGRSEVRILFVFDPERSAVLLVAGDKSRAVARLVPARGPARRGAVLRVRQEEGGSTVSDVHSYDRDGFLSEFYPEPAARAEVEAGAELLVAASRAHRLAEMRRRVGLTQAEVADRMHVRQERVSAIERAKVDASELRTLAAYVKALGGRLEVVADFGGERLVIG